ncbi:hypothetical protein [Chryseobacterium sp. IHB B 17019]|nr:hypothetical protein [Chryseobacterium sp. IHB B 17019]
MEKIKVILKSGEVKYHKCWGMLCMDIEQMVNDKYGYYNVQSWHYID